MCSVVDLRQSLFQIVALSFISSVPTFRVLSLCVYNDTITEFIRPYQKTFLLTLSSFFSLLPPLHSARYPHLYLIPYGFPRINTVKYREGEKQAKELTPIFIRGRDLSIIKTYGYLFFSIYSTRKFSKEKAV